MWNRKGEEIEPPPPKLNDKEKMLLKKFLQIKLTNAWQGWKGWWMDNKRYPGLVRHGAPPSAVSQHPHVHAIDIIRVRAGRRCFLDSVATLSFECRASFVLFFSQRVMRRSDFCDVLLCLRDGGPGGDKPGGRLAGSEQRLDRLAHLPRAEGGGEIGRLAASLCSMWPDPDKLAKEKEDAPLPAGWIRRESLNKVPGERYFVNTGTNYATWCAPNTKPDCFLSCSLQRRHVRILSDASRSAAILLHGRLRTRPLMAESRPNSRSSRPPSRTSPTRPGSRPLSRGSIGSSSPSRPSSRAGRAEGAVWADFRFGEQVEEVIGETPYPLSWPRVTGAPGDADPKLPVSTATATVTAKAKATATATAKARACNLLTTIIIIVISLFVLHMADADAGATALVCCAGTTSRHLCSPDLSLPLAHAAARQRRRRRSSWHRRFLILARRPAAAIHAATCHTRSRWPTGQPRGGQRQ
jgi:hypothetical protein